MKSTTNVTLTIDQTLAIPRNRRNARPVACSVGPGGDGVPADAAVIVILLSAGLLRADLT
jgi:hypothetical protein